jgi:hypothetical protein
MNQVAHKVVPSVATNNRMVLKPSEKVPLSALLFADILYQAGLPPDLAWLVIYLFKTVLDGRNTPVADGVQRALGRPPRNFADYLARTAPTGVWGAAS